MKADTAIGVARRDITRFQAVYLIDRKDDPFEHVHVVLIYKPVVGLTIGSQGMAYVQLVEFFIGYTAFVPDQTTILIGVKIRDPFL